MQDMPNSYIIVRGGFVIRIKELRESRGLQQKDLAIDLGVTQPTISGWESGIKVPSAHNTQKIADYFHVSVDYLLGRDEFWSKKNNILTTLNKRNLTLDELSKKTGIPLEQIQEFSSLKKTAGMRECLETVAEYLGVTEAYLIGKTGIEIDPALYCDIPPKIWKVYDDDPYAAYDAYEAIGDELEEQKEPANVSTDGLDPELLDLIKRIPDDRMPEVERYLRFQAEQREKP